MPPDHLRAPRLLVPVGAAGFALLVDGLVGLEVRPTGFGASLIVLAQLWWIQARRFYEGTQLACAAVTDRGRPPGPAGRLARRRRGRRGGPRGAGPRPPARPICGAGRRRPPRPRACGAGVVGARRWLQLSDVARSRHERGPDPVLAGALRVAEALEGGATPWSACGGGRRCRRWPGCTRWRPPTGRRGPAGPAAQATPRSAARLELLADMVTGGTRCPRRCWPRWRTAKC